MSLHEMLKEMMTEDKEKELRTKLIKKDEEKIQEKLSEIFPEFGANLKLKEGCFYRINSTQFEQCGLEKIAQHQLINGNCSVLHIHPAVNELLLKYCEEFIFVGMKKGQELVVVSNIGSFSKIIGIIN